MKSGSTVKSSAAITPPMPAKKAPARKLVLLIGTLKGVFLYHTDERRAKWKLTGPHLGGWEVFSLCGDSRSGRILAGTENFQLGPVIRVSSDLGKTWVGVKQDPRLPKANGLLTNGSLIWVPT